MTDKVVTVNYFGIRPRGWYRVTAWVGDKITLHGKIETHRVKGKEACREKVKFLKEFYAKEDNLKKAGIASS